MRKLAWLALLGVVLPFTAGAQETPAAEVSVGYSYLRLGGSDGDNQNGGSASVAFNVNHWLGIVGDFGGYHSTPFGVNLNTYTYLFGPRFSLRSESRATPFFQTLLGGSRLTANAFGTSGSGNAFAYSVGGGVDVRLSQHVAFRPQAEYLGMHSNGSTLNCARVTAAIVFRFGGKK
ncbi:MAG TPA: outer membrane beta-barrel protein [Candidatus Limnocylindrales bacterium]|nr:outer membrane beta-barrel protein [Candidatus Limnocylindrales bacterium]